MIISYSNKYGQKVFEKEFSFKQLEKQANLMLRDPKFYRRTVIILGCTLYIIANGYNPVIYAYGPANIDKLGLKFWSYVKVFAKWSCLIMAGLDTVKALNSGDTKSITKVMFKYLIAYGVVALLPWLFDELDGLTK